MHKHLLIIIFIFLSLSLKAQNSFLQYGASIEMNAQFRYLKNSDNSNFNNSIIENRNSSEKVGSRPSLTIDFKFNLNSKLGIRSGITYNLMGYRQTGDLFYFNSNGNYESLGQFKLNYFHHYIGVPTLMSMALPLSFGALELSLGAQHNIYLSTSQSSKIKYDTGEISTNSSSYKSYETYLGQAVFVINYLFKPLENNLQFCAGLNFKYGFTPVLKDTPIKEFPYSAGISAGFLFGGP